VVVVAAAVTLVLASCTPPSPDPAEPLPDGSTLPSASPSESAGQNDDGPAPVSRFAPCDDAAQQSLSGFYSGEFAQAPTTEEYPDFLLVPSCVFESPDQVSGIYLDASPADFEEIAADVAAEQGAGAPDDGSGFALDGRLWTGDLVFAVFYIAPGLGAKVHYVAVGIRPNG
jgi:hypothetical protein